MNKTTKIFLIIGIITNYLIIILSFLCYISTEYNVLESYESLFHKLRFDFFDLGSELSIIFGLVNVVLMFTILGLQSKRKFLVILTLVLSAFLTNILGLVASIITLCEIHSINREAYINNPENQGKFEIIDGVIYKNGRKPIRRLELNKTDLVFAYIGVAMGIILSFAYFAFVCFNVMDVARLFAPKATGPGGIALIPIYIIIVFLVFVVMLIPLLIMIGNVVLTLAFIGKRRNGLAKVVIIYGFICLTIFNSIAAIRVTRTRKIKKEEENKEKDLIN